MNEKTADTDESEDRQLREGLLAFDVAKQSLVEVMNVNVGTVEQQDDAMQDLIANADGNRAIGTEPDMQCVEVQYIGVDQGGRSYTMPISRIKRSPELVHAASVLTREAGVANRIHPELRGDDTLDSYS